MQPTSKLTRLTRPAVVAVSFALALYGFLNFTSLPFAIPHLMAAPGGKTILNVLPYYSAERAYEHIAAYTPEAVATIIAS